MEEAAFFSVLKSGKYVVPSYVGDPDVWHEALVTWHPSVSIVPLRCLPPEYDHFVELMAGANAGPLWIGHQWRL